MLKCPMAFLLCSWTLRILCVVSVCFCLTSYRGVQAAPPDRGEKVTCTSDQIPCESSKSCCKRKDQFCSQKSHDCERVFNSGEDMEATCCEESKSGNFDREGLLHACFHQYQSLGGNFCTGNQLTSMNRSTTPAPTPTLSAAKELSCSGDTPFECSATGTCYSLGEYCNADKRQVEACFPGDKTMMEWCHAPFRETPPSMSQPACRALCSFFLEDEMNRIDKGGTHIPLWVYIMTAIIVLVLIVSVVINIVLLIYYVKNKKTQQNLKNVEGHNGSQGTLVDPCKTDRRQDDNGRPPGNAPMQSTISVASESNAASDRSLERNSGQPLYRGSSHRAASTGSSHNPEATPLLEKEQDCHSADDDPQVHSATGQGQDSVDRQNTTGRLTGNTSKPRIEQTSEVTHTYSDEHGVIQPGSRASRPNTEDLGSGHAGQARTDTSNEGHLSDEAQASQATSDKGEITIDKGEKRSFGGKRRSNRLPSEDTEMSTIDGDRHVNESTPAEQNSQTALEGRESGNTSAETSIGEAASSAALHPAQGADLSKKLALDAIATDPEDRQLGQSELFNNSCAAGSDRKESKLPAKIPPQQLKHDKSFNESALADYSTAGDNIKLQTAMNGRNRSGNPSATASKQEAKRNTARHGGQGANHSRDMHMKKSTGNATGTDSDDRSLWQSQPLNNLCATGNKEFDQSSAAPDKSFEDAALQSNDKPTRSDDVDIRGKRKS